jgi:hypothetical protein
MAEPWARAGFDCICVDVNAEPGVRDGVEFVRADVRSYWPPIGEYAFVAAFPPCTHLAASGARWWKSKGFAAVADGLDLVAACERICEWTGAPYFIENPIGRLSNIHKPDHKFDPCDFGGYLTDGGDAYTKRTCLWTGGGFVMPELKRVEPVEGSKMHRISPSKTRADDRSVTPKGFAIAVFQSNNPLTPEPT